MIEDPDPTTGVGKKNKKKQKKWDIEVVETGDDDEEDDKRVYSQLGKFSNCISMEADSANKQRWR